jgi:hypothetical protein
MGDFRLIGHLNSRQEVVGKKHDKKTKKERTDEILNLIHKYQITKNSLL